jgi:hypothetical protein
MYVTIRRYRNWAGPVGEVARRARETLVPALRAQPGFRLYCAFEAEGDDAAAVSLNICGDREQATLAQARVLQWARAAAGDLLVYPPEVAAGPCSVCEERLLPRRQDCPLYVTVREHYGLGPEERVTPPVREHVLPAVVRAPGFRAFFAFMDRDRPGHGVGVTLFDTRGEAAAANERAVAAMLEKGIAPYPPRVTVGEALVLEVAEGAWPERADGPAG